MSRFSFLEWPVVRQFRSSDSLGRGEAVTSPQTRDIAPRTSTADRVVQSVCPYCAVGCGQRVYVKDERSSRSKATRIRRSPAAGSAPRDPPANSWSTRPAVRRRCFTAHPLPRNGSSWTWPPPSTWWPTASSRPPEHWQQNDEHGRPLRRTMGIAVAGRGNPGQRRELPDQEALHRRRSGTDRRTKPVFDTPPRFPVWEPRLDAVVRRNHCRTWPTPTASSFRAPTWPSAIPSDTSGWRRPRRAERRSSTSIPRFTRTTAVADKHVPIRAGSDVVLLGALINYVITNDLWFKEYVLAYTNAATLVDEDLPRRRGPGRPVLRFRPGERATTTCRPGPMSGKPRTESIGRGRPRTRR